MSISDGAKANGANFNAAFVSRTAAQSVAGGKQFTDYIATTSVSIASAATIASLSSASSKVRLTGTTATTLQGILAGVSGQMLIFYNITNQSVTVKHQNASASANDRIITFSGADLTILAGDTVLFSYDGTVSRWVQSSVAQSDAADITALTGDVTGSGSGAVATTIANGVVTNAKLANMSTQTIRGRTTAGTGVPEDLTSSQATAILDSFVGDSGAGGTKGLVPAPSAGSAAAGKYLAADGTFSVPASGSGVGTNFITNYNAETNTTGWATYADAAGTSPVDGTGGSPTATFTRTTSTPLIGTASFLFTKGATNRQSDGASYAFTIDSAFKSKNLNISFEYAVASGTFTAGTSTTDSDITVWIYDVTNSVLIQPSTYKLFASNVLSTTFNGTFQASSNSTSYRLIFHVGTTNAVAYTVLFDNVLVQPATYVYGSPVTDWQSYTPTGSWVSNTTYTGKWRRVGDSMEIQALLTLTGAPTNTALSFTIPSGFTIDTTKMLSNVFGRVTAGHAGGSFDLTVLYTNTTTLFVTYILTGSGTTGAMGHLSTTAPFTWANTDTISVTALFPITGWSSSVQMSDQVTWQDDVGEISSFGNASTNVPTNFLYCDGSAVSRATYSSLFAKISTSFGVGDGSTTFNLPDLRNVFLRGSNASTRTVGGVVYPAVTLGTSTTDKLQGHIHQNTVNFGGTNIANGAVAAGSNNTLVVGNSSLNGNLSMTGPLTDGTNGTPRTGTETAPVNVGVNYFIRYVRSASPVISATETVAVRYSSTAATVISDSSNTQVPFATKSVDTHGAWSGTVFTTPVSGLYRISGRIGYGNLVITANTLYSLLYRKNGAEVASLGFACPQTTSTNQLGLMGSDLIQLVAGETIDFVTFQAGNSATRALSNDSRYNYISIQREGN